MLVTSTVKVLVTGGHGFVGSHVVEELLKRQFDVYCLVRPTSNLKWIKNLPVTHCTGDVQDKNSLLSLPRNIDYVFHIAGIINASSEKQYFDTNQLGTLNILNAVQKQCPTLQRFVYVSSVAACGPAQELQPKTEKDEINPVSIYGKSKLGGEKMLQHYAQVPYTILRPPPIYGPRDRGLFSLFFAIKKLKGLPLFPPYKRYYSLVHVRDLAEAIVQSALSPNTIQKTYNIVNSNFNSIEDLTQKLGRALNIKTRMYKIPTSIIYTLVRVCDFYAYVFNKTAPISSLRVGDFKAPYWIFSAHKANQDFGWKNNISLEEGFQETALWYIENKWL